MFLITLFLLLILIIYQAFLSPKNYLLNVLFPLFGFVLGIFIQKAYAFFFYNLLITTVFVFILFFSLQKVAQIKKPLATICFLFAGTLSLSHQIDTYKKEQNKLPKKRLTLIAQVLKKENLSKSFYKESLLICPKETNSKIICYHKHKTEIMPGDIIKLKNVKLNFPKSGFSPSGNPTFADYLIKEKILATVFLKRAKPTIIGQAKKTLSLFFYKKRELLFRSLEKKMPKKTFQYFSSIFLGNKQVDSSEYRQLFAYWGISHHLARSGLHIAIFILTWATIFSFFPFYFLLKHLFLILICIIYSLFSWPSISFLRALSLFLLYELGIVLNKKPNVFYLLSLVAISVLVFNPMQLFFLGFQLSFGITLALTSIYSTKR